MLSHGLGVGKVWFKIETVWLERGVWDGETGRWNDQKEPWRP